MKCNCGRCAYLNYRREASRDDDWFRLFTSLTNITIELWNCGDRVMEAAFDAGVKHEKLNNGEVCSQE